MSTETTSKPATRTSNTLDTIYALVFISFLLGGLGYGFSKDYPPLKGFVDRHWPWLLLGWFLLLVVIAIFPPVQRWFAGASPKTRVGLMVWGLGGLSVLVLFAIALPERYQVLALRAVFLIPACLFPATLYYLFIATRKYGLLNEFIVNLDRLGLLQRRGSLESDSAPKLRLRTYLQKFEAVYGSLPPELVERLLVSEDPRQDLASQRWESATPELSSVFSHGSAAPLVISTVLIALGWLLTLPPEIRPQGAPMTPYVEPFNFAFLGAYFFSIQMLFRRYIRRDLRGAAYSAVALRILLAVIGTWVCSVALGSRIKPATMSVFAFAIGFFPPVAWQIVRSTIKKITFAPKLLPSLEEQLPLSDLDGLNIWHQTRFEEEDVESLPNMATADLVDLFLNTRIPPDRIIDWVDQAILYLHLPASRKEEYRTALHEHGIRTASALIYAYERSSRQGDLSAFERIIPEREGAARSPIRSLVMALFTYPNLHLVQAWRHIAVDSDQIALMAVTSARDPTGAPSKSRAQAVASGER